MTSLGTASVRRTALWSLLALSAIACGAPVLQPDAGRDARSATGGAGAAAGQSGSAGGGAGAGPGAGGTSGAGGAAGATGGSTAGTDGGVIVATDAGDGPREAVSDARDGGATTAPDAHDGATTATDAHDGGAAVCGEVVLFGLIVGDSCFDVVSVEAGANDGCMLGVADAAPNGLVGAALPFNYDQSTGTVSVGTMGALGRGPVRCNVGTLTRESNPSLASLPQCTWVQTDTSLIHLTATNELDLTATETQNAFTGCPAADVPAGGACTSTWTWHLKKGSKTWPSCQ
jgi:hypothetical protein